LDSLAISASLALSIKNKEVTMKLHLLLGLCRAIKILGLGRTRALYFGLGLFWALELI
jgi:hypothetical protein